MEVSGEKKTTPTENFSVEVLFWCHFGAMWGQCWAIWGLGWDHVGSFGGLCGAPWRSLGGRKQPQPKTFWLSMEVSGGN